MKFIATLTSAVLLTACSLNSISSKDSYDQRADKEREIKDAQIDKAINKAPKWMIELPVSNNAVYANGTAVSSDMGMADYKAKLFAYGKICMTAGGKISQEAKMFIQDTGQSSSEVSELAIRSVCPSVDITGTEIKDIKRISEGGKFRSYVLVSLPIGDSNNLKSIKDKKLHQEEIEKRSKEEFEKYQN